MKDKNLFGVTHVILYLSLKFDDTSIISPSSGKTGESIRQDLRTQLEGKGTMQIAGCICFIPVTNKLITFFLSVVYKCLLMTAPSEWCRVSAPCLVGSTPTAVLYYLHLM